LDQEDGPDQQGVKSRHHQLLNVDNNGWHNNTIHEIEGKTE
jgi:hypothetical protein